jgi:hypothetical protein
LSQRARRQAILHIASRATARFKRSVAAFDNPSMALDGFWVLVVLIAAAIVAVIVRAVRLTNASIADGSPRVGLQTAEAARSLVHEVRGRDVRCPRCRQDTFALLSTSHRYKCDSCAFEFDGPTHIPGSPRWPNHTP